MRLELIQRYNMEAKGAFYAKYKVAPNVLEIIKIDRQWIIFKAQHEQINIQIKVRRRNENY